MKVDEYYTPDRSLLADFESLGHSDLEANRDREAINQLIMNFLIKYLSSYLGLPEGRAIEEIAAALESEVAKQKKVLEETSTGTLLSGNMYGESDLFAIQCLADMHQTAALFKEIAFTTDYKLQQPGRLASVDLGTGSGILLAACLVAAKRAKVDKVVAIGVDHQPISLERAERTLSAISDGVDLVLQEADILDPSLHQAIARIRPDFWISETISGTTPAFMIDIHDHSMQVRPGIGDVFGMMANDEMDPLPKTLEEAIYADPTFVGRMLCNDSFVFPNPLNATFHPNQEDTTLAYKTFDGAHRPLYETGKEFKKYDFFQLERGLERWGDGELDATALKVLDELMNSGGKGSDIAAILRDAMSGKK